MVIFVLIRLILLFEHTRYAYGWDRSVSQHTRDRKAGYRYRGGRADNSVPGGGNMTQQSLVHVPSGSKWSIAG